MPSFNLEREDHMRNTERKHLPPEYLERLGTVTELICVCGHVGERHEMEPPYPCYECSCESYTVTAIPPPVDPLSAVEPFPLDRSAFEDAIARADAVLDATPNDGSEIHFDLIVPPKTKYFQWRDSWTPTEHGDLDQYYDEDRERREALGITDEDEREWQNLKAKDVDF
jgi:hypothetical protein